MKADATFLVTDPKGMTELEGKFFVVQRDAWWAFKDIGLELSDVNRQTK